MSRTIHPESLRQVPLDHASRDRGGPGGTLLALAQAARAAGSAQIWGDREDDGETELPADTQAEAETRERLLALLIDTIPAFVAYYDRKLICRFANVHHVRHFGHMGDWIVGRHAREMMGEEVYAERLPDMKRALAGETVTFTHRYTRPDGRGGWTDGTYQPHVEDGEVQGFIVHRFDITGRKHLEGALERERQRADGVTSLLSRLLELTGRTVGITFLQRTVQAMSELLRADLVFVTRIHHGPPRRARVIVAWEGDRLKEIADYETAALPSELLYTDPRQDPRGVFRRGGAVVVWRGCKRLFPVALTSEFEGFVGLKVLDARGEAVAQLTALFRSTIDDADRQNLIVDTVRFFVTRIEAELERMAAEEARALSAVALFEEKERLRVTLRAIGDGVIVTDSEERVTMMNAAAEALTGARESDMAGRVIEEVAALCAPDGTRQSPPARMAIVEQRVIAPTEDALLITHDGRHLSIDVSAAPVFGQDGGLIGSVTVLHDVTQARDLLHRVRHLAHYDTLTGLPNRALFRDRLEQTVRLAARNGRRCALLFLDMDRFKHVNDTFGHGFGDELLVEIGRRLSATVRASDSVARLGGDEFVVMLSDVSDAGGAALVARKILDVVAGIERVGEHAVDVSFSIGIAMYPDDAPDAEQLLMRADSAMYQAKDGGRNTYALFDAETQRQAHRRVELRTGLSRALAAGQFGLLYQPKFDLRTGAVTGAEALLRWYPEPGQMISPVDFIPIAEESGLIVPIGEWVIDEACRQQRAWRDSGLPAIRVAVNVSMRSLCLPDFAERLQAALARAALPSDALEIEITETAVMTDPNRLMATLESIRRCGVKVAVDDFGTGLSSLAYLQRLPIDTIKVDRAFVRGADDSDGAALVKAIVSMANALRKHVVAEGIETETQRKLLLEAGCVEAQGFLISQPVGPDEFARLLVSGAAGSLVSVWSPTEAR